ncbi:MAG: hypothetical protein AAGD14_16415 [Planctomycetota bacterium]
MADTTDFYFGSYDEWRRALTERCGIKLTPDYARTRIAALQSGSDRTTQEFVAKYGEAYRQQVIRWFEQAERSAR